MCITSSVGAGGRNNAVDVITVKLLLNMNRGRLASLPLLKVDGRVDAALISAIEQVQRRLANNPNPDRRLDPGGRTLRLLREGMPAEFTQDMLWGVMPYASTANVARYFPHLVACMQARSISTPLRQAHFLAQLAHESGSLRYVEELASGEAYEGRADLGNTQAGDGRRFKGRGLIQLTGRANYQRYGQAIGVDLTTGENWRTVATDPARAVDVAGWFWEVNKLNNPADDDDVREVTRRINGGYNGLDERKAFLVRAKFFLGI